MCEQWEGRLEDEGLVSSIIEITTRRVKMWSNPLKRLTEEERDIFYEFGGLGTQELWWAPIVLFVNLVKLLRKKGVI